MLSNYGYEDGSGNYYITIDTDKCSECGEKPCLQACPQPVRAVTGWQAGIMFFPVSRPVRRVR